MTWSKQQIYSLEWVEEVMDSVIFFSKRSADLKPSRCNLSVSGSYFLVIKKDLFVLYFKISPFGKRQRGKRSPLVQK